MARYSSPMASSASVASSSSSSSLSQKAGPSSIGSSSSVDNGEVHCFCSSDGSATADICFCVTKEACMEAVGAGNNTGQLPQFDEAPSCVEVIPIVS